MSEPKVLLVDMDAIVADLATHWNAGYAKMYPDMPVPTTANTKQWDVGKAIGDNRIYGILKQPGLYRNLPVIPGSQRALKKLYKLRVANQKAYNILFLTAATAAPHILADKSAWLEEHFPFIGPKNHIYAYQKELIYGDYFIDDAPKNLDKWKKAHPKGKTVTIGYPYNEGVKVDFNGGDYTAWEAAWERIEGYLTQEAIVRVSQEASPDPLVDHLAPEVSGLERVFV